MNEDRVANRNRLRPPFVSSPNLAALRFTYPLNESGRTTLDRVDASMLVQASDRTIGLSALLMAEQYRRPNFLRLANALSALYPK